MSNNTKIQVKEFMSKSIVSVDSSVTLSEAAQTMGTLGVGSIIVLNKNIPVGIVTERDFVIKAMANDMASNSKITQIMSSPIIYVNPETPVLEVADLMAKKKIRKMPVISDQEVVGIFTTTDILNLFTLYSDEELKHLYFKLLSKIYDKAIPVV